MQICSENKTNQKKAQLASLTDNQQTTTIIKQIQTTACITEFYLKIKQNHRKPKVPMDPFPNSDSFYVTFGEISSVI